MDEKITLTVNQLMGIFIAGREFERGEFLVDTEEMPVNTSPDFDEYMKETYQINLEESK